MLTYLEAAITKGTGTSTWTPATRAQWGCRGTSVPGTSIEIGTGQANTKIITDAKCVGTDGSPSAASIAATYNGGGKDDWFLPSRKELDALCFAFFKGRTGDDYSADDCMGSGKSDAVTSATDVTPGWSFASDKYWSSSEDAASGAWRQDFENGYQPGISKPTTYYVRPVRAF